MKWQTIILLLIVAASANALELAAGRNQTLYAYCTNITSGAYLGTNAVLNVTNETGLYYSQILTNIAPGRFAFNLTNLSINHCYALGVTCSDSETVTEQWGTVCVTDSQGGNMLVALILLPLIFVALILMGGFLLDNEEHKTLRSSLIPLAFLGFVISAGYAATAIRRIYGWNDVSNSLGNYTVWAILIGGIITLYIIFYVIKSMMNKPNEEDNESN